MYQAGVFISIKLWSHKFSYRLGQSKDNCQGFFRNWCYWYEEDTLEDGWGKTEGCSPFTAYFLLDEGTIAFYIVFPTLNLYCIENDELIKQVAETSGAGSERLLYFSFFVFRCSVTALLWSFFCTPPIVAAARITAMK